MCSSTHEENPSKMELLSHESNPAIEKIGRKASLTTNSETRQMNFANRMQVMSIRQQPFLKQLMEKEIFVDIKVVHTSLQNFIIIPLLRRYMQQNMELKNSNFLSLDIIFWWKWTCPLSQKCFSSNEKCLLICSYSDGQIGFHNGPSKSSTSKEKIT